VIRTWSLAKCLQVTVESALPDRLGRPIFWSMLTAFGAACITTAVALPLAWFARRGGWKATPAVLIGSMALAIPAPLLGVGMIELFNDPKIPLVGALYNTIYLPMLAQAFRALPLVLFIIWFALRTIPEEQFEAAAIDGAGSWLQFRHIALRQRVPALIAAWLAAFLLAFNELPATILLEAPGKQTLPIAVNLLMHGTGEDRLAGIGLLMLAAYAALMAIGYGAWKWTRLGAV
jgi:ABC-type Fe3+ transport system permease subunit